jgi:hypothetical protein
MLHSTALPESCSPPTLVRGWFGDAMAILERTYRRPCIRSFPECDTSSISTYMQHQYLTGPHRQGSMMATYDSIRDGESYGCAPYIRRQYFTEAYRTLARFRTGSHDLAGTTGRWMRSSISSADEDRICSVCRLHSVHDDDHFIFEYPVYRFLRTVEYPDTILYALLWARQTSRGLLVTLEIAFGHGHMCGHLSLEPLWLLWDYN